MSQTVPPGWDLTAATCDDGSPVGEHRRGRRRGRHLHVHEPEARPRSWWSSTPCPTTPRTSRSRPAAGSRPTSFSLDDDSDGTLSNTRTFTDVPTGAGYSLVADGARPAGTRRAPPAATAARSSNINVGAGRDGHLHVHEPQARPDRGRQGRAAQRPAGLLLHGRRRPVAGELLARRRLRRRRSRTRSTFTNVAPGSGYSLSETVPSGWDQTSATCSDGSPVSNINVAPGETVTCTFTNHKRGQIVVVKDAQPDDPQDFSLHGRRRAVARPASSSTTTPTATLSNTRTFDERRARRRLLAVRDACRAAGTRRARPATTAARCRTSTSRAGETVTCTFTNQQARADRGREGRRARTTRRTSASRPAAASRRPSFQLDDDSDADALEHAHVHQRRCPAPATRSRETVPSGWDQTSATCDDGSPVSNIDVGARRDRHLHVHEPASAGSIVIVKDAQPNDPQDFAFTAGGGLCPASFQLDDDSDGDALEHAHVQRRAAGGRLLASPRPCRPAGTRPSATCDDGSPVSEHRRRRRRDRHLHVHEPQARRRSWSSRTPQPERRAGLLLHGRRRPLARRASRSTTTPTATLSNTQHVHERAGRRRLLGRRDACRPAGTRRARPATTAARCRTSTSPPARRSPARSRTSKRGPDRGRQGRHAQRPAGLRVHGRRRPHPRQLPARRRRRRDAVEHAHVHRRRRRAPATRSSETVPSGWDQTARHLRRRQPGVEHRRRRPARPSPARSRTASAARSWS